MDRRGTGPDPGADAAAAERRLAEALRAQASVGPRPSAPGAPPSRPASRPERPLQPSSHGGSPHNSPAQNPSAQNPSAQNPSAQNPSAQNPARQGPHPGPGPGGSGLRPVNRSVGAPGSGRVAHSGAMSGPRDTAARRPPSTGAHVPAPTRTAPPGSSVGPARPVAVSAGATSPGVAAPPGGAVRLRRALLVALLAGVLLGCVLALLSVFVPGLLPAWG